MHRDIKPANIMLGPDGYVKIMDFGVAKLIENQRVPGGTGSHREGSGWNPVHTQAGWVIGTPRYMASEQLLAQDLDGRSDIYALGVVLYEMLAGRSPFEGSAPTDLVAALSKEAPPLRSCAPQIPPALEVLVAKAMAKDREKRYASARDMLTDLVHLDVELDLRETRGQANLPVPLKLESVPILVPQRSRTKTLGAAVVGLLVLATAAGLWWQGKGRNSPAPVQQMASIAVLPFVDMSPDRSQEYVGDGLAEELLDTLAKTPGLRVAGRTSSFQFKGKQADVGVIAEKLHVTTILEGSVRKQGNRARISVQTDQRQGRFSGVVGDFRPRDGRYPGPAGGDCPCRDRGAKDKAAGRESQDAPLKGHQRPGIRCLPDGPALS